MPSYLYGGPSHYFTLEEGKEGTKKGTIGTFPASIVERYSKEENGGHLFTPVDELKANAVKEAEREAAKVAPVTVEERNVTGAKSGT